MGLGVLGFALIGIAEKVVNMKPLEISLERTMQKDTLVSTSPFSDQSKIINKVLQGGPGGRSVELPRSTGTKAFGLAV